MNLSRLTEQDWAALKEGAALIAEPYLRISLRKWPSLERALYAVDCLPMPEPRACWIRVMCRALLNLRGKA